MMKLFLLPTLLILAFFAKAQSDALVHKRDSLSYRKPFFSFYPVVLKGGKKLGKEEAENLLSKNSESFVHYKQYRRRYKIGLYSLAGMLGSLALSSFYFDKGSRGGAGAGLAISVYSFVNSVVFLSLGEAKLRKAIKTFNYSQPKY